jgi:hypothetical protein
MTGPLNQDDSTHAKGTLHFPVPNSRFMASVRMGSTSGATLLALGLVS